MLNSSVAKKPAEHPLGILTTENRDRWAEARQHLVDTRNEASLKTIDTALFCVSLDDEITHDPNAPIPMVQSMLHGKADGVINR